MKIPDSIHIHLFSDNDSRDSLKDNIRTKEIHVPFDGTFHSVSSK